MNSGLDENKQNHEQITTNTHAPAISTRLKPELRQQLQVSISGNNSTRITQYISDKLVCRWKYPSIFLGELKTTTKLRIMSWSSGTSTPRAYGVKPVTNELQQAIITAARQSQTSPLLLPCAQGYRSKSKCSLPQQTLPLPAPESLSAVSLHRRADARGIEVRSLAGTRHLFSTTSTPGPVTPQPSIQWVPGSLSRGVKRPGREADQYSPEASAAIINGYSDTPPRTVAYCSRYPIHIHEVTVLTELSTR